ncbi:hypothetical protein ABT214_03630 [Micromonospora purpureochromogenes]|uniref:hypothetical protein n=1 Tax=Micromonospora purpureochromogenes TaxID=47872 RepID=UPI00332E0CC6
MKRTAIAGTPPTSRSWYSRLSASVGTATALAVLVAPSVASASTTDRAPAVTPTTVSTAGVPAGFAPTSTSWTSPADGWVLGFAPCRAGSCPTLVSTADGAQTWQQQPAPRVSSTPDQTKIHFANKLDGWTTDGQVLMATHDGAGTWRRVRLSGAVGSVSIAKLASTDRYAYAIVTHGIGSTRTTQLYSSPLGADNWQPVAGVAVPGSGGWDIATHGSAAYVALGVIHTSIRMWSAADGSAWTEVQPVCSAYDAVRLSSTEPDDVEGMCSFGPERGYMHKQLVESVGGAAPVVLGYAPTTGITTGFATTSAGSTVVAGVGAGASWLHASFDNGATWETPLAIPDVQLPMLDLDFQDATHGVVVWGGPAWSGAAVYRTTDGGHTWSQLTL